MELDDADTPKHKKKAKNKTVVKSDHKHEYETVLLRNHFLDCFGKKSNSYLIGKRCIVCGKISSDTSLPIMEVSEDGGRVRSIYSSNEKALIEYFGLPIVDYK